MPGLPTGTVTFLFTDIEGGARLWEAAPDAMRAARSRHDALLRRTIDAADGHVFKQVGDALCAAFSHAEDAVRAALAAQAAVTAEPWPADAPIRVRIALHTGAAEVRDNDYFGQPLNRVARTLAAGHGGQVLLTLASAELARDQLPEDASLAPLGEHRLKDLGRPQSLFQLTHPDLPRDFPPLRSLDNPALRHNLPTPTTRFIGREAQVAEVAALLTQSRLLTLTGAGGTGKTRLALQAAADRIDAHPDGVWWVELAPLRDPALVLPTLAAALGVREEPGRPLEDTLAEHVRDRSLLLAIDNAEHLVDACARAVDTLLRQSPWLRVLVTSRAPLEIGGETLYRVPPLSLPDPARPQTPESLSQYDAVRLLLDRAEQASPRFAVTRANAPAIAAVCHQLDGIPLAIELAAARTRTLSIEEIQARLDDRFRLLTGGSRTALPRQQTLRALIAWSWELLAPAEKALLAGLSVFAGGWDLDAVEAVCDDPLDGLASLVDKSLVVYDEDARRYRLLETIRQYARERLDEDDRAAPWRDRHLAHFAALGETAEPHLRGPDQRLWRDRLETERDNLRAALAWSLIARASGAPGVRLATSLWWFWENSGRLSEGRGWITQCLAAEESPPGVRSKAHTGAGLLSVHLGDYPDARTHFDEALALARAIGDDAACARALNSLGFLAKSIGDYGTARHWFEEALARFAAQGDTVGIARMHNNLGMVAKEQGDYEQAQTRYAQSLAAFRSANDLSNVVVSLINLGNLAHERGDFAAARGLLEEALALTRSLGDRTGVAYTLLNLGPAQMELGDLAAARATGEECLALCREIGLRMGEANALRNLGEIAFLEGDGATAEAMEAESLAISRALGDRRCTAISLLKLGALVQHRGDPAVARPMLQESLKIAQEIGDRMGVACALDAQAVGAAHSGAFVDAARLWGASDARLEALGATTEILPRHFRDAPLAAARDALGEAGFETAWKEGFASVPPNER